MHAPMLKGRHAAASRLSRLAALPTVLLALLLLKSSTEVFDFVNISRSPHTSIAEAQAGTLAQPIPRRFCDAKTITSPCIFDLGFNRGQSSAFYLRDPNALVLAVEANPILVEKGAKRFETQLLAGKFKIMHAGVAKLKGETLTFWVNTFSSKFSSFFQEVGCRYPGGKYAQVGDYKHCRRIEVKTNTCADLVRTYGTPDYLKVDVEGMDRTCLRSLALLPVEQRPRYVSKENAWTTDLDYLVELGYTKFKVVNQAQLESRFENDPNMRGTSGPWGEQAVDVFVGQRWQSYEEMKARMPLPKRMVVDGKKWDAWYDLHAMIGDETARPKRFCDGSSMQRPCIFDFGLNKGQSSAFYLRQPTARVLAVEANPALVKKAEKRFDYQIQNGRFKLVHAGVGKIRGDVLTFWVNTKSDKYSSLIEEVGCRTPNGQYPSKGDRTYCRPMKVKTDTCAAFIQYYGTPQYLKVDVEGMDRTCLQSLKDIPREQRPRYVSKENVEIVDFEFLSKLGYTKFKAVNQALLESQFLNDDMMRGTSGSWGEDAVDSFVGEKWQTLEQVRSRLPLREYTKVDDKFWKTWYDLHAKLE